MRFIHGLIGCVGTLSAVSIVVTIFGVRHLSSKINKFNKGVHNHMAEQDQLLTEIQSKVDNLLTSVETERTEAASIIDALKQIIAQGEAGNGVSLEKLRAIRDGLTTLESNLGNIVTAEVTPTPDPTPEPTPAETPVEGEPTSEVPTEVPAETPAETTPAEVPAAETPVETPVETPAEETTEPTQDPFPAETPVETPSDPFADAPAETVEFPAETPVEPFNPDAPLPDFETPVSTDAHAAPVETSTVPESSTSTESEPSTPTEPAKPEGDGSGTGS